VAGTRPAPPAAGSSAPATRSDLDAWLRRRGDLIAWSVLAAAMATFAALSLWLLRETSFFADELSWFAMTRGFDPEAIITPHNGHLIAGTRLAFATSLEVLGTAYLPFRLLSIASVIAVSLLLFVFIKRRVGAAAALAPAIVVLFLGSGSDTILAPVGISSLHSIVAGLGALIALDRRDLPGDLVACGLLIIAAASFSVGLAFVAGAMVWVLLEPDRWRRAWVFAVPVVLYGVWLAWAQQFDQARLDFANVLLVPNYAADAFAAAAGSLLGLNYVLEPESTVRVDLAWGRVIAGVAVVALALRMMRGPMPRAFWALLAIPLTFWIAGGLAWTELNAPNATRFVFPSAIAVLVVGAEAARGLRLSSRSLLVLFGVAVFALGANLAHLREAGQRMRASSDDTRVRLATIELARDTVAPGFSYGLFAPVEAGPYLEAVDRYGSIAHSAEELRRQREGLRRMADAGLWLTLDGALVPVPGVDSRAGCEAIRGEADADAVVELPAGGALLQASAPAAVRLRRFADEFAVEAGELRGRPWFGALRIPPDESSQPWQARIATSGPVTVCPLPDAAAS
jgi:hypothetical protein